MLYDAKDTLPAPRRCRIATGIVFGGSIIRTFSVMTLAALAVLLGAAGPAETPVPAAAPPGPEQWGIVTNLPGGLCGAKAPAVEGAELSLALSRDNSLSMFLAGPGWKIQPQTYEIVMQLDDLAPFAFTMHGEGPALVGEVPRDFRAELMTAGKIGFNFNAKTYTIAVRNLAGVVDRLDTCIQARKAAERQH